MPGIRLDYPLDPGHLDTMPGNILLAATGLKTLYVGYPTATPPTVNSLVWLTSTAKIKEDGTYKTIRVPVIIDSVGENAPRSKLTEEELLAAGYRDEHNLDMRLKSSTQYLQRAVTYAATGDITQEDERKLFMDTAPACRIGFHLATPQEVKALGHSVREAHNAISESFAALRESSKLEGRNSLSDATAFAEERGVDLVAAKLAIQNSYSNAFGHNR